MGEKQKCAQYALQKMTRTTHMPGFHAVNVVCGCVQQVLSYQVAMAHKNTIAHIVSDIQLHNSLSYVIAYQVMTNREKKQSH